MKRIIIGSVFSALFLACYSDNNIVNNSEKHEFLKRHVVSAAYLPIIPVLYKDGYHTNEERIVIESVAHLDLIAFNDHTSSLVIHKGPDYEDFKSQNNGKEPVLRVYEHADYEGKSRDFTVGSYSNLHTSKYSFGDEISSVLYAPTHNLIIDEVSNRNFKTYDDVPIVAEIYNNKAYANYWHTILFSINDISNVLGPDHNDKATSLYVKRGPTWTHDARVLFCKNNDYAYCTIFDVNEGRRGVDDLRQINLNDNISSVQVMNGDSVVIVE